LWVISWGIICRLGCDAKRGAHRLGPVAAAWKRGPVLTEWWRLIFGMLDIVNLRAARATFFAVGRAQWELGGRFRKEHICGVGVGGLDLINNAGLALVFFLQ
jgi:hypothetical protein